MIDGLGIAALGVGHGGFGEFGFEGEDVGGVALGVSGGLAGEGEHFGDVDYVFRADLLILVAGAGVVVALGEAQTALIDDGDLLAGVFEVLLFAEAKEDVDVVALELTGERGEVVFRNGVNLIEEGLEGSEALLVDEGGVHAGGVVVADFLLVGRAGGVGSGVPGEDAVELLGVDVVEGVELVDGGLVGGDGIGGGEVAAGVLVEVGAGVGGLVDGGGVEAGRGDVVGRGRGRGRLRGSLGVGERSGDQEGAEGEGGEWAVQRGCTTREAVNHREDSGSGWGEVDSLRATEADGDAGARPKDVPDRVLYARVRMEVPESLGDWREMKSGKSKRPAQGWPFGIAGKNFRRLWPW